MKIDASVNPKNRARDGLADIRIHHDDGREFELDLPFGDLYRRCRVPSARALDLLITASTCYIVDKTVPRGASDDCWSRKLLVSIPVSEPAPWSKVAGDLSETLSFLTGDEWSISFKKAGCSLFEPPKGNVPLPVACGINGACLFSGGLDSLSGAIDLLSEHKTGNVLLVGHYDASGPRKVQGYLAAELQKSYPQRVSIEHVRVAHRPAQAVEDTLRSRSLVFIALGLYGAQAGGPEVPLYMFENGLIALNVPLTPSRRSSCSTRTMHPFFLDRLRSVLADVGIENPIINPYRLKTKGECMVECKNQGLLNRLADISVSCSHWSRRQDWIRKSARNCGYCVPCICRRAALYRAGIDDGHSYGRDVINGELALDDQMESANDLRAVTDFIRHAATESDLRSRILAVATFPELDAHAKLAVRGIAEIKAFLSRDSGSKKKAPHA